MGDGSRSIGAANECTVAGPKSPYSSMLSNSIEEALPHPSLADALAIAVDIPIWGGLYFKTKQSPRARPPISRAVESTSHGLQLRLPIMCHHRPHYYDDVPFPTYILFFFSVSCGKCTVRAWVVFFVSVVVTEGRGAAIDCELQRSKERVLLRERLGEDTKSRCATHHQS